MAEPVEIDVWTDFACPFCYLSKPRLDEAIAATGRAGDIRLRYRAFELFPEATERPFDSFEHVVHKMRGDEAQALRLEEQVAGLAKAQGQPYLIHHPVDSSVRAHRMLKLAASHGLGDAFIDRLQGDLFGAGTDVYHADYLRPVALELGLPVDGVDAVLDDDAFGDEVREDLDVAREIGVTGVPFTVLDGRQAIPGMTSVDGYRRAIDGVLAGRESA